MEHTAGGSEIYGSSSGRRQEGGTEKSEHSGELRDGEDILDQTAKPHTEVVDRGQEENDGHRDSFHADLFERNNVADERDLEGPLRGRTGEFRKADKLRAVFREDIGESGYGSGLDDRKNGPA